MTAHQLGVVLILWVLFSALAASVWMCTADLIRWLDRRRDADRFFDHIDDLRGDFEPADHWARWEQEVGS